MGRPRGFAHATFEDAEAAKRAVDAAGFEPVFLHGRQLRVEISNARTSTPGNDTGLRRNQRPTRFLVIRNFFGTEQELLNAFRDFRHQIVRYHIGESAGEADGRTGG